MKTKIFTLMVLALLASLLNSHAIENLRISVVGSNAVLSWPSLTNQTFIVEYRETWATNTPWTSLALNYPAKLGTNWTTFIHSNIVVYPPLCTNSSTPGDPSPLGYSSASAIAEGGGGMDADALPYPWNPKFLPGAKSGARNSAATAGTQSSESESGCAWSVTAGFYRVVQRGVRVIGLTNGTRLSGQVLVAIEVGHTNGEIESVSLTANGAAFEGASLLKKPFPSPYLYFSVDTLTLSNFIYDLEVTASLRTSTNEEALPTILSSPVITVSVTNEISFPDWISQFGQQSNSFLIKAVSLRTNVDWQADIYGTNDAYVGSFTNHTANGLIQAVWNLRDGNGVLRNDPFFNVVVSVSSGGQLLASAARAPTSYRNFERWVGPGDWVIANQQAWDNYPNHDLLDIMTDNFVVNANAHGYYALPPGQEDGVAFRIPIGYVNEAAPDLAWALFKQAVTNAYARNLFYFGHGGPDKMGLALGLARSFPSAQIRAVLHTAVPGDTNRHSYRFVFIDGCNSATGDLPPAFGIAKKENRSFLDYSNAGMRPNAFVGWKDTKWIHTANTVYLDHINFIGWFLFEWYQGQNTLRRAFELAKIYPDTNIKYSDLKIYGYEVLKYDEYNNQP